MRKLNGCAAVQQMQQRTADSAGAACAADPACGTNAADGAYSANAAMQQMQHTYAPNVFACLDF